MKTAKTLHAPFAWRYGCIRMKSRSPPLASSFQHRLPSPCDMKTRHAPYSLTARRASRLAVPRGSLGADTVGRRSEGKHFHVPYSLAARRASRLARCGRGRLPAATVGTVAVGRSVTTPSPPTLNPLGGAAFGRSGRSPVKTRARTLLTRRSQSLAARSVRSRSVGGGGGRSPEGRRSMCSRSEVAMPSPPIL